MLAVSCDGPDRQTPEIAIERGWTREMAPGQAAAAVYLRITNRGAGDDRLVDADSPVAERASLHSSASSGGVARMRAIDEVPIPAHSSVDLKPGGTHIMLTGLKQRLSAGGTVGVSLGFARSGRKPVTIRVVPATADDHSEHGMRR